jgi:hypothetical protein
VAATSEEAFKVFLGWLAPRDIELAKAAAHREEIRARLDRKFGVRHLYAGGSLHHRTGVHQVSGADYFCWLDMKRPTSSASALTAMQKTLQRLYPDLTVRIARPAVVVDFADGAERVAVIPAFAGGETLGDHVRFRVPGVAQDWMSASPLAHGEWLERCNSTPGVLGGAKGLARLVRAWKHYRDVPISSFYLELRAAAFMAERSGVLYPYDLRDFLATVVRDGLAPIEDPSGVCGPVEAYLAPSTRNEAMSKAANAAGWAESALTQQRLGSMSNAFRQWNTLFGGRFPSLY